MTVVSTRAQIEVAGGGQEVYIYVTRAVYDEIAELAAVATNSSKGQEWLEIEHATVVVDVI